MNTLGIKNLKVAISGANLGSFPGILQSLDYTKTSEKVAVKNQTGETCAIGFFDVNETLNCEIYCTGSLTLTPGDLISVTDTDFTTWAGTTWVLEEVGAKGAVGDGYLKATGKLSKHALITS